MTQPDLYTFRAATMADLDMLIGWQSRPHVQDWWDDDDPFDAEELADARVSRWIVSIDGTPFAYMQDYAVHGWDEHHFAHLPTGTRGIDQYIADANLLGQGHGPAFIAARLKQLFDDGAPMIATDPNPDNARAISAYEKLGFQSLGPAQDTEWGTIQPMGLHRTP